MSATLTSTSSYSSAPTAATPLIDKTSVDKTPAATDLLFRTTINEAPPADMVPPGPAPAATSRNLFIAGRYRWEGVNHEKRTYQKTPLGTFCIHHGVITDVARNREVTLPELQQQGLDMYEGILIWGAAPASAPSTGSAHSAEISEIREDSDLWTTLKNIGMYVIGPILLIPIALIVIPVFLLWGIWQLVKICREDHQEAQIRQTDQLLES